MIMTVPAPVGPRSRVGAAAECTASAVANSSIKYEWVAASGSTSTEVVVPVTSHDPGGPGVVVAETVVSGSGVLSPGACAGPLAPAWHHQCGCCQPDDSAAAHRAPMRSPRVVLRRLTPDDGAAVDAVFAGLSSRSRYLRFHTPVPRLSGSMRTALLDVDGHDRVALVAEVRRPGGWARDPVGIARLYRTGAGEAELAVAVVDAWQGRGIGRRLLTELGGLARDLGHDRLFGLVLPENGAVVGLLQRVFPGAVPRWDDGVVRVVCPLTVPEITDHDLIAVLTGWR